MSADQVDRRFSAMEAPKERKAKNEAAFRIANEELEPARRDAAGDDEEALLPFLCECSNARCTTVVGLTRAQYENVRSVPTWSLAVAGHEDSAVERVVQRNERFVITEKFGEAGRVAADTDPRA